jgi:hypothetical protein
MYKNIILEAIRKEFLIKENSNYDNYKKNWRYVGDSYTNLIIEEPLKLKTWLFPNENGFYIELFFNNNLIGHFHSYYDNDEGLMNDSFIIDGYQNKGFGKILLLLAIDIGNDYLGFFSSDVRGLNQNQYKIYSFLKKENIISDSDKIIDYDKANELISIITKKNLTYK